MTSVLDDLDTRPGSASSLLRTVVGAGLRQASGWMSSAAFVTLLGDVDVPAAAARNALSRAKAKGLLVAERREQPGYSLTPAGRELLRRGDRRIFQPRFMAEQDAWCLISFSLPEAERALRHQLRRRLTWIGCGTVTGALWICPAFLQDEVREIAHELAINDRVTLFRGELIRPADSGGAVLAAEVARWWDLPAIAALHENFLIGHTAAVAAYRTAPQPASAYRAWIHALDRWRPIPYLDPGLPTALLPADWPGTESVGLFLQLRDSLVESATDYIRSVAGTAPNRRSQTPERSGEPHPPGPPTARRPAQR